MGYVYGMFMDTSRDSRCHQHGCAPRHPLYRARPAPLTVPWRGCWRAALPGFFPHLSAQSSVRSPSALSHRSSCTSSARRAPPASARHSAHAQAMATAPRPSRTAPLYREPPPLPAASAGLLPPPRLSPSLPSLPPPSLPSPVAPRRAPRPPGLRR